MSVVALETKVRYASSYGVYDWLYEFLAPGTPPFIHLWVAFYKYAYLIDFM